MECLVVFERFFSLCIFFALIPVLVLLRNPQATKRQQEMGKQTMSDERYSEKCSHKMERKPKKKKKTKLKNETQNCSTCYHYCVAM